MKKNKVIFAVLILSVCLTSCFKHDIEGNGNVITETRTSGNYFQVHSEGDFDVYFTKSNTYSIEVEAESNLMPYITTEIHSNSLIIKTRDHRNIDNNYPVNIYISAPFLSEIEQSGSGNIYADSIIANDLHINLNGSGNVNVNASTNQLKAKISGSGDIFVAGTTGETDFAISGSGSIHSYTLEQDTCFADISGSGSMYVSVADFLDIRISGSGRVYYKGNPVVNTFITGSGSVIHQ